MNFDWDGFKNWNISNATTLEELFYTNTSNLTTPLSIDLDLSYWDFRKVTNCREITHFSPSISQYETGGSWDIKVYLPPTFYRVYRYTNSSLGEKYKWIGVQMNADGTGIKTDEFILFYVYGSVTITHTDDYWLIRSYS